MVIKKT